MSGNSWQSSGENHGSFTSAELKREEQPFRVPAAARLTWQTCVKPQKSHMSERKSRGEVDVKNVLKPFISTHKQG